MKKVEEMMDRALGHGDFAPKDNPPPPPEQMWPASMAPALVERLTAIFAGIPDIAGDDFAIVERILSAESAADLDSGWRTAGLGEFLNQPIEICSVRKGRSAYSAGLPYFLLVEFIVIDTAEICAAVTGAVSVVAQLLRAHAAGWLPLKCRLRQSDKQTAAGYLPQHLEIIR